MLKKHIADSDWENYPRWAKYRAINRRGFLYYYEKKPTLNIERGEWLGQYPGRMEMAMGHFHSENWENSLEELPE